MADWRGRKGRWINRSHVITATNEERPTRHTCRDCETFRIPPLVSKRTIRVPDDGGYSGVGGLASAALQPRVAVEQKFSTN